MREVNYALAQPSEGTEWWCTCDLPIPDTDPPRGVMTQRAVDDAVVRDPDAMVFVELRLLRDAWAEAYAGLDGDDFPMLPDRENLRITRTGYPA